MVGALIYYSDTSKFYEKHYEDIHNLLQDYEEETGCNPLDSLKDKNPLYNWMAWFGFESVANKYLD